MSTDKKTIGIIPRNQPVLKKLVAEGTFATENDAAKFAFALAAKRGVAVGTAEGADTKWAAGSFDSDQSLRLIVAAMFDDTPEPYRLIECLINRGLELLDKGDGVSPDVFGELLPAR
ncbi:hypothetical protein LJR016_002263 [Devosia sp. LjRoot16]|uniref:hypothetical protein n=1 Tax=Devosia sp. LjRoot16 TaxID=3342271 RepID=UPI003ECD4CB6